MSKNDEENENKVIEDSNDIDKASNDFDYGLNEINRLNIIKDQAVKAVEDGDGFTEREAKMADVSLEHIYRRLHYKKPVSRPSLENYKSENIKLETTKRLVVSLEADEKTLWGKFKAFCLKIWNMIVDMLRSLFSSIDKTKKKADDLHQEINSITGKTPTVKTFRNDNIFRAFFFNDDEVKISTLVSLLELQRKETKSIMENLGNLVISITDTTEKYLTQSKNAVDLNKLNLEYKDDLVKLTNDFLSNISTIQVYHKEYKIGPFVNNRCVVFNIGVDGKLISNWQEFIKLSGKIELDLPVLNDSEMKNIYKAVIELLDDTKRSKEYIDRFGKAIKDITNDKSWNSQPNSIPKEIYSDTMVIINAMNKMSNALPTLNLVASSKALTYIEDSLEFYK